MADLLKHFAVVEVVAKRHDFIARKAEAFLEHADCCALVRDSKVNPFSARKRNAYTVAPAFCKCGNKLCSTAIVDKRLNLEDITVY